MMKKLPIRCLAAPCFAAVQFKGPLLTVKKPVFKKDTVSIARTGAMPEGNTLNAKRVNGATETLSEKRGDGMPALSGLWPADPIVTGGEISGGVKGVFASNFCVSEDRSRDIQIKNTDAASAGRKILYELEASGKSVSIK